MEETQTPIPEKPSVTHQDLQRKRRGKEIAKCDSCEQDFRRAQRRSLIRNVAVLGVCLVISSLLSYYTKHPYTSYIPIMIIAVIEWYRSYTSKTRSYYGLCRLLLYILIISLWVVFILRFSLQGLAYVIGYHHIPIRSIQHLFPYALMFATFARTKNDMDLHDRRRYIIHLLYDVPAFLLVIIFKLLNNPLNSLFSEITEHCYLGCLPTPSDVKKLDEVGIKNVVNMCAEYFGPRKTYKKYQIKQLRLPTVDSTAPSLKTIEKAIAFMKEAYEKKEKIFVHCKSGMARSATVVLCHLIANENLSAEDALKLLKEKRPEVTTAIIEYIPVKQFLASLKDSNKNKHD